MSRSLTQNDPVMIPVYTTTVGQHSPTDCGWTFRGDQTRLISMETIPTMPFEP